MSALISALDNYTPSQTGENGSTEYTWSNSLRERMVQLSFQLTRTRDSTTIQTLKDRVDTILKDIHLQYKTTNDREQYLTHLSIMYRLVGHTRDIIDGKGEYALAYMLLDVWHKYHPALAQYALKMFVLPPDGVTNKYHPYGSWKDINYVYKNNSERELAKYGSKLIIEQLRVDVTSETPSLLAKWVPREKSQFGELFYELATEYFSNYVNSAKSEPSRQKAIIKAKMNFRKLIAGLNKQLDTVQIKQCGQCWREIDPAKQTSITMHKQKNAFLNLKNKKQRSKVTGGWLEERRYDIADRIICADNFTAFAKKADKGEVEVKGARIGLNDFTKEALRLSETSTEASLLNAQWLDNSKQTGSLGKMIAMVDVSGSMSGDPLHAAIALGIRVAEKSILGKRVMTFSGSPNWVNLEGHTTFVDMVKTVAKSDWGVNTNFYKALQLILDAIVTNKLKPEDVEDMVLVIFSDMQMDEADRNHGSLMDTITDKYAKTGMHLWGKPFTVPHILFWNLRSTSGFPTLSTKKNASMMSGFSPALLNLFCDEGLSGLQQHTPWSMFIKGLQNERYDTLENYLRETL